MFRYICGENLVKHQKVSKYYDPDCRNLKISTYFINIIFILIMVIFPKILVQIKKDETKRFPPLLVILQDFFSPLPFSTFLKILPPPLSTL